MQKELKKSNPKNTFSMFNGMFFLYIFVIFTFIIIVSFSCIVIVPTLRLKGIVKEYIPSNETLHLDFFINANKYRQINTEFPINIYLIYSNTKPTSFETSILIESASFLITNDNRKIYHIEFSLNLTDSSFLIKHELENLDKLLVNGVFFKQKRKLMELLFNKNKKLSFDIFFQ